MTIKPKYYQEAERLLGIQELPGKKNNHEEILQLWEDAEIPDEVTNDEVPWCAAFVNGTLVRGNKASTQVGLARSFKWDKHKDIFDHLDGPELYAIGVMSRGNSTWEGHVGYVADFDDKYVWLLGGNQSNAVNITRYPRSRFNGPGLGFVRPTKASSDISRTDLKKDSRALKTSSWFQQITMALTAAGTAAYQFVSEFKGMVQDNTGLFILVTVGVGVLAVKAYDYFTINAYEEGRYLPKSHE